jgi:transposase
MASIWRAIRGSMSGPRPVPLVIAPELRAELARITRSTSAPHGEFVRACMLLLCADGVSTQNVARRTGQTDRSVRKWKARMAARPSVETLRDAPRSGRKPRITVDNRVAVVRIACERPDGGDEKNPKRFRDLWTHQSLADEVIRQTGAQISKSEVGRILRFHSIRPHMVTQWLTSTDKDFDAKAARVCALYVAPPGTDVVVCIDEKPILIRSRRHPTWVARDGSLRWEFEYVRHGICVLLAAFDIRTGRVIAEVVPRRTAEALVAFLQRVANAYPGKTVHVVWDNLNTHYDGKDKRWTKFNRRNGGRFRFVHTPIHASWLNQVEIWFSILQRRVIRYGDFSTAKLAKDRVMGFVEQWNDVEAHPFRWTWRSDTSQNARRQQEDRSDRTHAQARC